MTATTAPARCPATLRPWRGAPGEDQAAGSEVCGKRGPLGIVVRHPLGSWSQGASCEQANAIGPTPFSAHLLLSSPAPPRLSDRRRVDFACLSREFAMSVSTAAVDQSVCAPLPVLGADVTVPLVTGGRCHLRRPRLRGQRPGTAAGLGRRGRLRPVLRQRAPRRRIPLAALHRPVREQPARPSRSSSAAARTTRWSSPARRPTPSTCSPPRCPPTARCSCSRPSTTPRCCPGATPGCTYLDAPRTPGQAVATLERALADRDAPRPRAGLRHRRVQRHR